MTAANTVKRKKSKKWTLKSKLIPQIRRIWLYSPLRREALALAKVGPGKWRCKLCQEVFSEVHVDHIKPVVDVKKGFEGYDTYLSRHFPEDKDGNPDPTQLQILCLVCHEAKTLVEKELRKVYNKKRKKKEDVK